MRARFEKKTSTEQKKSETYNSRISSIGNPSSNPQLIAFSYKKMPPDISNSDYPFKHKAREEKTIAHVKQVCSHNTLLYLPTCIFQIEMQFADKNPPQITEGQKIYYQDIEKITRTKQLFKSDIVTSCFIKREVYENIFQINDHPLEEYLKPYSGMVKNVDKFLFEYENSDKTCTRDIDVNIEEKAMKVLGLK